MLHRKRDRAQMFRPEDKPRLKRSPATRHFIESMLSHCSVSIITQDNADPNLNSQRERSLRWMPVGYDNNYASLFWQRSLWQTALQKQLSQRFWHPRIKSKSKNPSIFFQGHKARWESKKTEVVWSKGDENRLPPLCSLPCHGCTPGALLQPPDQVSGVLHATTAMLMCKPTLPCESQWRGTCIHKTKIFVRTLESTRKLFSLAFPNWKRYLFQAC